MSVIGGFLVAYSLRLPVYASLVPYGLGCLVVLLLQEPRRHKMQEGRHLEIMWRITKESIIHNVPLRCIIILNSVIALMTMSLFWYTQPYQTSVGLPLVYFGLIHAVIVLIGAIASKYTHSLEQYFDDRLLLTTIALTVFISFIALGYISSLWALVFFGFARIGWGILSPLTSNIINRMVCWIRYDRSNVSKGFCLINCKGPFTCTSSNISKFICTIYSPKPNTLR